MDFVYVQVTGLVGATAQSDEMVHNGAAWVIEQVVSALETLAQDNGVVQVPEIIDLEQMQRYQHLHMGMLLSCDTALSLASLSMALRSALASGGLQVSVESVPPERVAHVQALGTQHAHVLTLLSRSLSAEVLKGVSALLSRHGLHVTHSERLTTLPELVDQPVATAGQTVAMSGVNLSAVKCVVEFRLQGDAQGLEGLKHELVDVAHDLGVDLVLQRDDAQRRMKRLAVFDMDSTLIKAEVIDELAALAGVGQQVSEITERAMRGEIDFQESFRARMALLKGLPTDNLARIAAQLPIMDGAKQLFSTLKAYGVKTAIISGGFTYFAQYLQKLLGIDHVFANTLAERDGVLTGEVVEPIVDAQKKAEIVKALAAEHSIDLSQVVAVGDGANDLLMLKAVGTGIAFRAKPIVRQSSKLALTTAGLEGVLYLMGLDQRDHH